MPLPPGKERFDLPAQLVDQGDLLGGEIKAAGGDPVGFAFDRIADQSLRGLALIDPFPAQQNLGIVKDKTAGNHGIGFKAGFDGVLLDAGDEMLTCRLELVEIVMALVASVAHRGFSRCKDPVDKGTLSVLAAGEEDLAGHPAIEVKADMGLGLFGSFAVVGPLHGEDSIDQRAIDGDQRTQFGVLVGEHCGGLFLQGLEDQEKLFETAFVHGFEERTLGNTFLRGDMFPGKGLLF